MLMAGHQTATTMPTSVLIPIDHEKSSSITQAPASYQQTGAHSHEGGKTPMATPILARLATGAVFLVCILMIVAALIDLHCTTIRPGDATFILACRASRLEAPR